MQISRLIGIYIVAINMFSCNPAEVDFGDEKPDQNRFTKVTLVEKLDEPMELEVLDDGKVIIIERKGKIKMYDPDSGETSQIGFIPVYPESEDGLLGLAKDPGFNENQWIYLYYSPAGPDSINRLSRFTLKNNLLNQDSEKIMLEIPVFRGCCHSGGSIEFDSQGNLYLSLGDDTSPFESDSYNPIDERPGRAEAFDAQRSSANSNDLRGGIIRIKPTPEGGYTIPEGNLFPVGTKNSRPEIYVKGNRNPFRISLDPKNGFLYWGEVGPDAGRDSLQRGPKGYDEVNQARKAGFFGWPYFIADNKPYWYYDFETQKSIYEYKADSVFNNSPNNTGVKHFPDAQPAFIYYPYSESIEFPLVGEGGRNAMAGPVFYHDLFEKSEVKFPKYYHGKLFIYDWMRNWIFLVTMDADQNFQSMEQFMPSTKFDKPMDMQFGADGALYVLEYGTYWNAQNDDSGLYRIEFSAGNRKPIAHIKADKTQGAAPLEVRFSGEESYDFDEGDTLIYAWSFDGSEEIQSTDINPVFEFDKPGNYKTILTVRDRKGKETISTLDIEVGNEPPTIRFELEGNKSFYWGKSQLDYHVEVNDLEDGSLESGTIPEQNVLVTLDYLQEGFDRIESTSGHQQTISSPYVVGQNLTLTNGCNACHAPEKGSVGPSYLEVARFYRQNKAAEALLIKKVETGGSGVWGERLMPSHSHIESAEISEMVRYILSLGESNETSPSSRFPVSGKFTLDKHMDENINGTYILTATYEDMGALGSLPILRREQLVLRHPLVPAANANRFEGAAKANHSGSRLVKFTEDGSYLVFENIDLTGIDQLEFSLDPAGVRGKLEIRTGGVNGSLLGETKLLSIADKPADVKGKWFDYSVKLQPSAATEDLYIVFKAESDVSIWNSFLLNTVYFGKQ